MIAAEARKILAEADLIVPAAEVQAALGRLAEDIARRLEDANPLVLTVMGGAVVFAGRLLPLLRMPLDLDYLHATRYGAATAGGGIEWRMPATALGLHYYPSGLRRYVSRFGEAAARRAGEHGRRAAGR